MANNEIKVSIRNGSYKQTVKCFTFPAGEVSVDVSFMGPFTDVLGDNGTVTIEAKLVNADGIMQLLMVKDAVSRMVNSQTVIRLFLPYVPYARQDRVCNEGEALSIKVMCDLINSMNFHSVCIVDPHSDVTPALINNCVIVSQVSFVEDYSIIRSIFFGKTLVSPDAGAIKKVDNLAKVLGKNEVINGFKKRDLETGKLSGFGFHGSVIGKDLIIVDDICDGGGTFVGLCEVLKQGGAKSVELFVTHGIFSKGVDKLIDNGIDFVYTTDSFLSGATHKNLRILQLT